MFEKFNCKPKQVEAVQFTDETKDRIFNCIQGNVYPDFEDGVPVLKVTTIHGDTAIIRFGDWIIKDADIGTYYPIKDKIMKTQYFKVD